MPKLTWVVHGETKSVDIGDSCSIGSLAGNTVTLDAADGVSRRHCQIIKLQNGYELADLGSTNGTKVDGSPVKKHKLSHGDRIEVGKVTLTYEDPSAAAAQAAKAPEDEEISLEEHGGAPVPVAAQRAAPSVGASEQCILVHAGGDKDGQKVPLDKPRVTFGRNPKNTVVLADAGTSGFHAEIAREGGTYVLRDLGSTNGTLVDGEPVSEIALQHGARIRMGTVRFVFVDPTVSDFEKAMAGVDDLGSEWGLLRAEMDMSRVQKARRSQFVLVGLVLAVAIGAGVFIMMNPDALRGQRTQLASVPGNKVDDPSFEETSGADWAPRPDSPTRASIAGTSDGAAKQGTAFFGVTRSGGGGGCAAAQSSLDKAFTVSPGRSVEFGAQVRTTDGALAGVRIVWLDKRDSAWVETGRNSTRLVAVDKWTEAKGVAMPPEGARKARLELVNAASGTAWFDDVFFVDSGAPAGGRELKDGAVDVVATGDGQISVSREVKLLRDGAGVGGALRADAVIDPSLRGDRSGSQSVSSVQGGTGEIDVKGEVVIDVQKGAASPMSPFQVIFKASGGRFIDVMATLPADAAWVATLPDEFFTAGIGVRTEKSYGRALEPRIFEAVDDVSFGGPHRFRVTKREGGGPFRMALVRVAQGWEVAFGAGDGKQLAIRIDTDSAELIKEVQNLKAEADTAVNKRQFGIAIVKLRQLSAAYPSGSAEQVQADEKAAELDKKGRGDLDDLVKKAGAAAKFSDERDLRADLAEAKRLGAEYAQHDVGQTAEEQATLADAALDKIRRTTAEFLAGPLLRKADDFAGHRDGDNRPAPMTALARAFYNEVVQRYPGTDAARKAGEKLAGLPPK